MTIRRLGLILLSTLGLFGMKEGFASEPCTPWVAQIVSIQGQIEFRRAEPSPWQPVSANQFFCIRDSVRVKTNSRAALRLANETMLRLDQGTTITFSEIVNKSPSWLDLVRGAVHFISRVPRTLQIKTPFVNAAIEGTEFVVRVEPVGTKIWVLEGQVLASNAAGRLTLTSGQAAIAEPGQPPVRQLAIRPRDAVQWALYYPPILEYRPGTFAPGTGSPALEEAVSTYRRGDVPNALTRLDAVSVEHRDAQFFTLRASMFLSVGRVDEALADIEQAREREPGNGASLALSSIIALLRNEKDAAFRDAQRAVELEPRSPEPRIARSYAYQARFDIENALQDVQEAERLAPDNALASARLAELWLSLGDLDRALDAARRAVANNPVLARTQTVLGFAHLTRIEVDAAKKRFQMAIALDQAAPLPRLGLGLATIRKGELAEGRQQIEIATSLDPNNSLIRSYLGKAYFEEERDKLAATELAAAKELDPQDPTPWFYDAIRKQTDNRPGEALLDLDQSIKRNNNRAVYRSRLLLDEDLAARSTSQARIYQDLGFEQLALLQGWRSTQLDPSNYSSHRLLSDSYSALPRHEIARVSELLQSQLLQPLNLNPLQPQLAEANLFILEGAGPGNLSFNEFTPLFTRNGMAVQANGVVGNHNTWGDSLVVSGLHDQFSYSAGQFHYETDGFRDNNDLEHNIYNAFAQIRLSPRSNLQVELRSRETDNGDLLLRFDPDLFFENFEEERDEDTLRLGYHFAPSPTSHFILSVISADVDRRIKDLSLFVPGDLPVFRERGVKEDADVYTAEAQYSLKTGSSRFTTGIGHYNNDIATHTNSAFIQGTDTFFPENSSEQRNIRHSNAYTYSNFRFSRNLILTLGASADSFHLQKLDIGQINPKFGVLWHVSSKTTLRFASLRNLKRSLVSNQTIEPTQVAGFTQFFDDRTAADSKRHGIGLDHRFSRSLFAGAELSWRDVDVPIRKASGDFFEENQDERQHRAYLYWLPHTDVALTAEAFYENFERDSLGIAEDEDLPEKLKTRRFPLTARYWHPSGFFGTLRVTYIDQDIEGGPVDHDKDSFFVTDTRVGYRLSKRRGIISLGINNLFDKEFKFHDVDFQTGIPRTPFIQPERSVFARLELAFF